MKIASVAAIKAEFSSYLRESQKGPVVVTRNGKAIGVILAVADDDDLEMLLLSHSPRFRAILENGKREIAEGKGIPHDQFWAELDAEYDDKPKPKANGKASRRKKPADR